MIILINPPVVLPSEPPAGIARLAGTLWARGIEHKLWDANIEGLQFLWQRPALPFDTWTAGAKNRQNRQLAALKSYDTYLSLAKYQRATSDLNRVLEKAALGDGALVSLGNYRDLELSPLRTRDLCQAALQYEKNPFHPWFSRRLAKMIEENKPRCLGFSLNYLSQALSAFAMAGFVRDKYPFVKIIMGGGLVTSLMGNGKSLSSLGHLVDRFVSGPGEAGLLEMLGIPGGGGKFVMPRYVDLPLEEYLSPGLVLPYSASWGCWWNRCTFCPERAEGNSYLALSARQLKSELARLVAEIKPDLIHFLDSSLSLTHLRALIDEPPGVPWYAFTRLMPIFADPDFCLALRQAGCVMLKLGLESGDQLVLNELNKGISVARAGKALAALKKAGIAVYVYLIFGTPAETAEAARRTLAFTAAHSDFIDYLNLAIFNMPAAGEEASQYKTANFYAGDLSLYTDFSHPAGWDRKVVRQFLEKEFKCHPRIAPIIRQTPRHFGSLHAPFFLLARLRQKTQTGLPKGVPFGIDRAPVSVLGRRD